ncbi:MAG: hypothetical protein ACUVWO_12650 [Thermodesulfobacteriota bacterium]
MGFDPLHGFLYGSLLSQGQVWIPASTGMTKKGELGSSRLEVEIFLEPLAFKARVVQFLKDKKDKNKKGLDKATPVGYKNFVRRKTVMKLSVHRIIVIIAAIGVAVSLLLLLLGGTSSSGA